MYLQKKHVQDVGKLKMPKLEDLNSEWVDLYDEWVANGKKQGSYQKMEKVDRKIAKIRIEIGELYIGDKNNANNRRFNRGI